MIQRKLIFVILLFLLALELVAQTPAKSKKSTEKTRAVQKGKADPVTIVEKDAQFVGGKMAFHQFISDRIQYPIQCQSASFVLQFVVDKIGQITEIKAIEESSNCEELVTNVTKILKSSPRWIPRNSRGQYLESYHEISIKYDNSSSFVQIGELKKLEHHPGKIEEVNDPTMNNAVIHMDINHVQKVQSGKVENNIPKNETQSKEAVSVVAVKATFVGGESKFREYVANNFQFPIRCQTEGIDGDVLLRFIVDETGKISNVTAIEENTLCPEFTAEAIRIIERSPRWIPGQNNGKFVKSYREIPIRLFHSDFEVKGNIDGEAEPTLPMVQVKEKLPVTESKPVQPETGTMAQFPGGTNEFLRFVQKNLVYPQRCKDASIQGKVLARFVVDLEGKISNVEILEHSYLCPEFSKEVTRVILHSPKWIPATINGKAVKSYQAVPIRFELEEK